MIAEMAAADGKGFEEMSPQEAREAVMEMRAFVRVGLEDTIVGRIGGPAPSNPAQVADLVTRGA